MKILFIVDFYPPHVGGWEILFQNMARRLVERGHSVTVLTSRHDASVPTDETGSDGVRIVRTGNGRLGFLLTAFFRGLPLAKESDILHTALYVAAIPASLLGLFTGKRVLLLVFEIFGALWKTFVGGLAWWAYARFERLVFLFPFDRYVCISHYTKNSLRVSLGIPDSKLVTIHCGVDHDFWDPQLVSTSGIESVRSNLKLDGTFSALFFGRPGVSKWLEYFLWALPAAIRAIPNFRAVIIASSHDAARYDYVRWLARALGVDGSIDWIQSVPYASLREYILAVDTVVVPSLAEGFWFSAAEACSLGQKLIVTNVGSLPEVVSGNVIFVEPANANDISRALVDMRDGNFQSIQKRTFPWDEKIAQQEKAYADTLSA